MELTVTYQKQAVGKLRIGQQGLYYRFDAACTMPCDKPLRLYAVSGMQSRPIGVLSKDGTLNKSISVRQTGELPAYAVLGDPDDGFLPWCGVLEEETITDAYMKTDGAQSLLALPVSDGAEVPLIAYASQMKPVTVCGRDCLQLPLENGKPILPSEEADDPEPSPEEKENIGAFTPMYFEVPGEL